MDGQDVKRRIEFVLPSMPPSHNVILAPVYDISKGMQVWKRTAEWWKWVSQMKKYVPRPEWIKTCAYFSIGLTYHSDRWFCKNGKLRRIDLQNMEKPVIDMLFEVFGRDDSRVIDKDSHKQVSAGEYVSVVVAAVEREGFESEKANESGGVLNPAVLVVGE